MRPYAPVQRMGITNARKHACKKLAENYGWSLSIYGLDDEISKGDNYGLANA